jgi:hypothetical protein
LATALALLFFILVFFHFSVRRDSSGACSQSTEHF